MPKPFDPDAIAILRAVRREARGRAELAGAISLSRNTVASRLELLMEARWVLEVDDAQGSRGRPFTQYRINPHAAYTYVANFGWDHLSAAICTLDGEILESQMASVEFGSGHRRAAIDIVVDTFDTLLEQTGIARESVAVTVVGLPNPVANPTLHDDWLTGRISSREFSDRLHMPVCVENDVNLMAMGARRDFADARSIIFVKVGTYIGAGLIVGNRLHSGVAGLAGEIGHIPVARGGGRPCMCGNRGCLANTAGLNSILESVSTPERPVTTLEELRRLVMDGNGEALVALRQAGRDIGEALVGLVVGLAPDLLVVGGGVLYAGDTMVVGIRESLDRLSLPALSSRLRVVTSPNHRLAGLRGAADIAFDKLLPARATAS